ncbi:MAG: hypothetical protein JRI70_07970 [Deltaproteobacteria bacterium]|nr:hypothetical protein [Deltaproteobacteria bacterium]
MTRALAEIAGLKNCASKLSKDFIKQCGTRQGVSWTRGSSALALRREGAAGEDASRRTCLVEAASARRIM